MRISFFFLLFVRILIAVEIEGIVLSSPEQEMISVQGIHFEGLTLPGPEEELKERLEPFLHSPLELSTIEKIKEEITSFYVASGHPFIALCVPEQKVAQGVLQMHLVEPKIGCVKYTGNRWFSTYDLSNYFKLKPGDPLRESTLVQELTWLNRNPFIHANAVISPGKKRGSSNLEIVTKDRFRFRLYSGVDNTGTDATGIYRYFAGANWAIHLRSLLSYQYTTAFDFHKFWSHFGSWTLYLPWGHELVFYGAYAKIHPKIDGLRTVGRSTQFSGRYSLFKSPLSQPSRKAFHFGYDYKQFNSALFFIEFEGETFSALIDSKNASVSQFIVGYDGAISSPKNQFSFELEAIFSPFHILPNQTKANYTLLREGAKPEYAYGKIYLSDSYELPYRFLLNGIFQAQVTGSVLLPSEQFGIGGYSTVRGYEEREYLADNGLCTTFEIRSPPHSFSPKKTDELRFLIFTDYGYGSLLKQSFNEKSSQNFWSIGGGLRYALLPNFTARIDYGLRLTTSAQDNAGGGRFHFSAIGSF